MAQTTSGLPRSSIKWLLAGSTAIAVLFVLSSVIGVLGTARLYESEQRVRHSNEVMASLQRLLALVTEAETGQRGYLLTGDDAYLQPYLAARDAIGVELRRVGQLTEGNIAQQARLEELRSHVAAKLAELATTISLRRDMGLAAAQAVVLTDAGKKSMDAARVLVTAMGLEEQQTLKAREIISGNARDAGIATSLGAGALGLLICVLFALALRRGLISQAAATAEIFEQKELFRTTLASIGDGVITTDVTARVTSLNAVAQALTGWPQNDAVGQPLETVFHIVNEDTRQRVENPAARALREGIVVDLANHTLLIRRDGAEAAIDDSGAPIRDAEGRVLGAVLVFRDISERRLAERRLTEAYERLQASPAAALPAAPPRITPAAASARPPSGVSADPRALTILIADDNPDSVESLGMLLRASGHRVELAHDGREAVESATRLKPDVVILDIGMPKLNGYDAARRIREQPWAQTTLLIAITGWGQTQDRQRSQASGFNHHLIKPVDAEELEELLRSFAARAD